MTTRIKNWHTFQHFKDRRPPWVKLYRDLLDDLEWHKLEPQAAKVLVMLWLIASEAEGELPAIPELAFRLRLPEDRVLAVVERLSHWLDHSDIGPISPRHQDDALEREEEKRKERERRARDFESFWTVYPKKKAKAEAMKAFDKVKEPIETLIAAVKAQSSSADWTKDGGRYIPHPATWLNAQRWLDSDLIGAVREWHETKDGVVQRGIDLGLGPWNETEQFPAYKARVMAAHQKAVH